MSALSGMKEICEYMRRSEATILKLIIEYDFPAVKISGTWESTEEKIIEWRNQMIDARNNQ